MSDTQSQENVIGSPNTTATPGELLSHQREQLGVPLTDAARALNLRPAVVAGLEQDNYQEIPVAAYRRGYLRAYAKYLGMDDRLVLEAYQAHNGTTDTERKVSMVSTAKPPSRVGDWLFKLVTLLVIVGLIAVTVMWWQSRGGNEPPSVGTTSTEDTSREQAEPADENDEASSSFTSGDESAALPSNATNVMPSATEAPASGSEENANAVAGLDEPAPESDTNTDENAELSSTERASEEQASEDQSSADGEQTATAETTNANILELTFNEQSWTEIFDANNQRVFVGLQTPGTSTSVEGEPPFRLTVGNATGVELRYQGEEVDLLARAGANNVARFTLGE
ncbi:RodZ domain-containing protein [Halomonas sp. SpR8]|uniref:RodZ domain-containing protein n=1 Tax=Halomonas sp. SpR8 TaxID=3050463 RepID=UPI0027E49ED4|nr:RodZ domain-containing protein [Halomonas sp. SpR8]MDQ7728046.1 DUF4115 domain-containing protein [Halomonas sp. SpR8]